MHAEETQKLLSQDFLTQTAELFSIEPSSVKHIGGFENVIYQGLSNNEPVIIRITHNDHRSAAQIYSELHWLQFLKDNGANVCGPFPSRAGNLVETIEVQGTPLHLSIFQKAPGSNIVIKKERENIALFQAWGRATGKLHSLTQSYQRPPELVKRGDIVDNFQTLASWIPHEPGLQQIVSSIVEAVRNLPKTEDWYGLIHSDIHSGNFYYDNGELHIFDFDDCCYHQFASDIAIPVYYAIWANNLETQEEKDAFATVFARNFLTGYLSEHTLSLEQVQTIPLLLRFRDCELLGVLMAEFGNTMNERQAALIETFKTRIMESRPIVNIEWEQLLLELNK